MRFLFIIFSVNWLLAGCSESVETFKEVTRPIEWTQVHQTSFDQVRRLSGTVYPVEATSLSFEVGGKVDWVKVNLGDVVKQGDELARLGQRSFKLNRQSAKANLQKANASLSETKNEFHRYAQLSKKGLVSKSAFDSAKAAFESAISAVNQAKAQLDMATKDLYDTLLTAPYNGKITKRFIEPSMQLSAGQKAFEIEGNEGLEIKLMVPETLIRNVVKNSEITIHYPVFPDLQSTGIITEIGTRAETANAFPVTILINSSLSGLRAGMTTEVNFTFQGIGLTGYTGMIFRIPISALAADVGQESYVFVYDADKEVLHKRSIQTENVINNEVLVSAGLKDGEIIATAGVTFLRDGQVVRLLDKKIQRFN